LIILKRYVSLWQNYRLIVAAGFSLRQHRLESLCHQEFLEQFDGISSKRILPEADVLSNFAQAPRLSQNLGKNRTQAR
jgi:hypothetical protein